MRRMVLYILAGLVVVLGVAFLFGIRGLKETQNLQICDIDLGRVADGKYLGRYEKGRFSASVEVVVKDHRIVGVNPLSSEHAKGMDKKTYEEIYPTAVARIIAAQSPNVDAVSGATATTKALLKAVENALVGAGGKASGD